MMTELLSSGRQAIAAGAIDDARGAFEAVLEVHPAEAEALFRLGHLSLLEGHFDRGIRLFRQCLAVGPHPFQSQARFWLSRALRRLEGRAELGDLLDPPELALAPKVALFGPPASGLDAFGDALARALGWSSLAAVEAEGENEPDLHLPTLQALARHPGVLRQALRCTEPTLQMLQVFAPRPVFFVRPLAAVLVDVAARLEEPALGGFLGAAVRSMDVPARRDYAARRWGPWLIQQYASFRQAAAKGRLDVLFVTDPNFSLRALLAHAGLEIEGDVDGLELPRPALEGPEHLDPGFDIHLRRLRELESAFPETDFSPLHGA